MSVLTLTVLHYKKIPRYQEIGKADQVLLGVLIDSLVALVEPSVCNRINSGSTYICIQMVIIVVVAIIMSVGNESHGCLPKTIIIIIITIAIVMVGII